MQVEYSRAQNLRLSEIDGAATFVVGTPLEIIKLAPVIKFIGSAGAILHAGRNTGDPLSRELFAAHKLPNPVVSLDIHSDQTNVTVAQLIHVFERHRPGSIVILADTNAALAGALAANVMAIPLVHVEAGRRTHDPFPPKDHSRILIDHLSDALCVRTETDIRNLVREGIDPSRIVLTGSPMPGTMDRVSPLEQPHPALYVLASFQRLGNTDEHELRTVLSELAAIVRQGWPVLLAPRAPTNRATEHAHYAAAFPELTVLPALGDHMLLNLAKHAALVVSDSSEVGEQLTAAERLIVVCDPTSPPEALPNSASVMRPDAGLARRALAILDTVDPLSAPPAAAPSPFGDELSTVRVGRVVQNVTRGMEGPLWAG